MDKQTYLKKRKQAFDLVYRMSIDANGVMQLRETSVSPNQAYWTHLQNVHDFLISWGVTDYEILLAAILHDVVEDTAVTLEEIKHDYSERVGKIVALVSKDPDFGPTTAKKYFDGIMTDPAAMVIKVADRIDNLLTHRVNLADSAQILGTIAETKEYYRPMARIVGRVKELESAIEYTEWFE